VSDSQDEARLLPPGLLAPLRRQRAAEQLADRLATALALGEFSVGERLPSERELSVRLQTSRATVSEALGRLTRQGYVDVRRGRRGGAYVLQTWTGETAASVRRTLGPRESSVERHQDFRGLVEGLVARTAAARRDDADVRALRAAVEAFRAAATLEQARALDVELHRTVAAAAHNADLAALSARLLSETTLGFALEPFTEQVFQRAVPQHQALVHAVIDGDGERAAEIATGHFTLTTQALRELLRRAKH